jgi:hypothetical protein
VHIRLLPIILRTSSQEWGEMTFNDDDSPRTMREVGYLLSQLMKDNKTISDQLKEMKREAKEAKANQRKMVWTIVTSVVVPILTVLIGAILTR